MLFKISKWSHLFPFAIFIKPEKTQDTEDGKTIYKFITFTLFLHVSVTSYINKL